jgi:hypothetical protein
MKQTRNTWAGLAAPVHTSALSSQSTSDDNLRKLDWLQQAIIHMRRGAGIR